MGEPINKWQYDDQAYTRPSGRVVLPKPLRYELELAAGDTLELESRGGADYVAACPGGGAHTEIA